MMRLFDGVCGGDDFGSFCGFDGFCGFGGEGATWM